MALTADVWPPSIATGTDGTLEIFQGRDRQASKVRRESGSRQAGERSIDRSACVCARVLFITIASAALAS